MEIRLAKNSNIKNSEKSRKLSAEKLALRNQLETIKKKRREFYTCSHPKSVKWARNASE